VLNEIAGKKRHRTDALWQSELTLRPVGEMLAPAIEPEAPSPLAPMHYFERIQADFARTSAASDR